MAAATGGGRAVVVDESEIKAEEVAARLEDIGAKVFFEKMLTSSDVSASGRVVVPKVCVLVWWACVRGGGGGTCARAAERALAHDALSSPTAAHVLLLLPP